MILGTHVIFGTYGFWLPNDPRGSWSRFVGSWELFRYGRATKTSDPRSLARVPHDHAKRLAAKKALKYPPVKLTGLQARAAGRGFAEFASRGRLVIWACSILPDHVHLVLAEPRYSIEQAVIHLKGSATRAMLWEGLHPLSGYAVPGKRPRSPWARGQWKVFLFTEDDVRRAIRYVEANPVREGLRKQRWSFVARYGARSRARSRAARG